MISINTNTASSVAAYNLGNSNVNLQRSLNRLSSGSRINSSFDDAGGLAVSMRLSSAIRRTEATQANVNNALSFLQTQDGVLKNADKVVSRISELTQLATDVTKSTDDLDLYQTEVDSLITQLQLMAGEEFNDVALFSGATTLTVVTSHDGAQTVGITQQDLDTDVFDELNGLDISSAAGVATTALTSVTAAIQNLATLRANNGSEQSRLSFAADLLAINKVNLESANSRIIDVDVASESANLARLNILTQAGTAMLSQANQSQQSILRLLV
jgi:flagellin